MGKPTTTNPLSLHEALIVRHYARDPVTRETVQDAVLAGLHDAMRSGREAAEKAARVARADLANEMMTPPARHRKARDDAWRVADPALRRFDAQLARAAAEVTALEKLTFAPPAPASPIAELRAAEVRARLAAMNEKDRRRTLAAPDDVVISAILHDPLGAPTAAEVVREQWRRARYPAEVDRLARLRKAIVDAERGASLLLSWCGGLYDDKLISAAEATEREAADALAS